MSTHYITSVHRGWDDFTFFAWGGGWRSYVARQRLRLLASLGVDALRSRISFDSLKTADIRGVHDLIRFGSQVENYILKPCYTSPEFRNDMLERIKQAEERYARFDPFGYCCEDEWGYMATNTPHDGC